MTNSRDTSFDNHMMGVALSLARRGLGRAWPNPAVGALIADQQTGEIIARGHTQPGGRPHAETEAIAAAGARTAGKSLYVTLEPCSHTGQTAPCVDAIIRAKLSRVVLALTDPDPRVSGRGIARLEEAGLEVTHGIRADDAFKVTQGHILRVTERRPFVQLKMALGPKGKIARGDGSKPTWVTGPIARAHGHMLRANADAILIGSQTLHDDKPSLTCRLPGMANRSPVRVIIGRSLSLRSIQGVIKDAAAAPLWIAHAQGSSTKSGLAFGEPAITGHHQEFEIPTVSGALWLPALAEALIERGITRLLVEGGPTIWRAFAKAALVDEVIAYVANDPKADRKDAAPRINELIAPMLPGLKFELDDTRPLGSDTMYKFRTN